MEIMIHCLQAQDKNKELLRHTGVQLWYSPLLWQSIVNKTIFMHKQISIFNRQMNTMNMLGEWQFLTKLSQKLGLRKIKI